MNDASRTGLTATDRKTAIPGLTFASLSFALSRGLTFEAIENATGLDRRVLIAAEGRLPEDTAPRLWRLISENAQPDEVPSVAMAAAAPLSVLGGLVEGAHFAATMGDALRFLTENGTFISESLTVQLHDNARTDEARLTLAHALDVIDRGRLNEVGITIALRVMATLLKRKVIPRWVDFGHAQAGSLDRYQRALSAPTHFDRERSQIVFDRAILDAPVESSNVELFSYVRTHFQLARTRQAEAGVPAQLRTLRQAILDSASVGDYRAGSVAARLGLSVRSAQREASAHGLTLSGMMKAARKAEAERLVADPNLSVDAVALLVGYSDERAFRRAFKAWTGLSPSAYRRQSR